ncbi:MAG: gluconate 2-dehydrogenase subunit 3 family protein [Bryobacterales bacterium]
MNRRTILKLIAAGVLPGPARFVSLAQVSDAYQPYFFSADEMALLDQLAEIIIPADEHSGGSRAARVNRYIDVVVSESNAAVQRRWQEGLRAINQQAADSFGSPFVPCTPEQQQTIVATLAAGEDRPRTADAQFFVLLKQATVDGYYSSKIGIHDELEYQGNTALSEFSGCTHPEH